MCNSNPQIEKQTIWGFTEEEITHRWEVHMQFDPLTRLFGSDSGEEEEKVKKDNSQQMMASLESLLSQG